MFPVTWLRWAGCIRLCLSNKPEATRFFSSSWKAWLAEITGLAAVSLQPNAGSQGEFTGLMVIREYQKQRGQEHRDVCLIPISAHGTNPASAVMAGFKVVTVAWDAQGNVDVADLREKAQTHRDSLGALMVTYPSTHGVFEETIREVCRIIHDSGGQVYMDGANMNAQVGLCCPGDLGADVCHLNLHKPSAYRTAEADQVWGPSRSRSIWLRICRSIHLPGLVATKQSARSAAPWGSASILVIPWMYIVLMGVDGLMDATKIAILNANYIAKRLASYFPTLYKGHGSLVAHECIVDCRQFKAATGVEVEDIAKRLMDYGFHAPTMSWPVPGTLMIEPTESESKAELDRFCDAMIAIHGEIKAIESGSMDKASNPLKNAPHTAQVVVANKWDRPYGREQAAFPAPWTREHKFWPTVGRVDNVYGDRHVVCTCVSVEAYESAHLQPR